MQLDTASSFQPKPDDSEPYEPVLIEPSHHKLPIDSNTMRSTLSPRLRARTRAVSALLEYEHVTALFQRKSNLASDEVSPHN